MWKPGYRLRERTLVYASIVILFVTTGFGLRQGAPVRIHLIGEEGRLASYGFNTEVGSGLGNGTEPVNRQSLADLLREIISLLTDERDEEDGEDLIVLGEDEYRDDLVSLEAVSGLKAENLSNTGIEILTGQDLIDTVLNFLNTAGVAELVELRGVGEVTARNIIDYRERVGGFRNLVQLESVSGIGEARRRSIEEQLTYRLGSPPR